MNRGDVHIYVGPATPAEAEKKRRPVVIVSFDEANQNPSYPYVMVVPITSNVSRVFPLEVDLGESLEKLSKAQPQLAFTCRKSHLTQEPIIALSEKLMEQIGARLKFYLEL